MGMHLFTLFLDEDLSLQKFGVIVEQSTLQGLTLGLHGIELFLACFSSLFLEMISFTIVCYLILQLTDVIPATDETIAGLFLCECFSLASFLHFDLI